MNEEVLANLERAQESIAVARELLMGDHHDFSASRSYYAVYQTINAVPRETNDPGPTGSHVRVIEWCVDWNRRRTRLNEAGSLDNQHRDLRDSLKTLLRWRREADYDPWLIDRQRAEQALNFARRMFEVVRRMVE